MRILLCCIVLISLFSCMPPDSLGGNHRYECLDTIVTEKYDLIRFKCSDPDYYKIDSFKLYK